MARDAPKKGRRSSGKSTASPEPPSSTTTSQGDPETNWADKPESKAFIDAKALYSLVATAYKNKQEQDDSCEEFWNIFNAIPDANQQYTGNSPGYVPAVRDCIKARAKRTLAQLFPQNNKHVDGISSDDQTPNTQLSLLEYYIRKTGLKEIARSDLIAGDVTGQWNLMVDWTTNKRTITKMVKRNPKIVALEGEDLSELGLEDPSEDFDATESVEITEQGPDIVDFATEDLAVVPPTCSDLQKAEAVSIKLRMTADRVNMMVDEGVFILPEDTEISAFCGNDDYKEKKNPQKRAVNDAGIKTDGTFRFALIYCVYTRLDFGDGRKESAIVYFGDVDTPIGIIKNPLWSGKVPILSNPVEKMQGSFFGRSGIEPVKYMQWNLTDFWNMGQDSAAYSLLPIYTVDPLKCPSWMHLTQGLAAIWPVDPAGVKTLDTPQLWKEAAAQCDLIERRIWQSFDVNEMMMGRVPQGRKNNALIGGMQQEASVGVSDHASRYERVQLSPLCEMLFEFDQQFRDAELMIEQRGEIGVKAKVEAIPVQQWGAKYYFRWSGTEATQGIQRLQQQIAWMNVLKGIPPQQLNGLTLDVSPIMIAGTEAIFGAEMAPRILVDKRNQYTVSPEVEDEMIHNGFVVDVHEADDDAAHMQDHMKAAQINTDPLGYYKSHIGMHMVQMQRKREMAMMGAPPPGGAPGGPGGGPGSVPPQGVAGTPRPGAIPAMPRGAQNPPGAVSADAAIDPTAMGRG